MRKKLFLVGSDHLNQDYNWLSRRIKEIKPDCITLEQSIDESGSLYWEFKFPLEQAIKEHENTKFLCGEFAAGIHYGRKKGIPIYFIDGYIPFDIAIKTNMNEGTNFEILHKKSEYKREKKESEHNNLTRRNRLMASAINYHFTISDYSNILHIGGSGHYDEKRCIPLQEMVIADSIKIIDAVDKTEKQADSAR